MGGSQLKQCGIMVAVVCITAIILSLIWRVPYLYTAMGFAVWAFAGHLITLDDDFPGGWSNPDGDVPFPWAELAIEAAVLLALLWLAFLAPALSRLGT
ncbi:hypothetical protein [Massilia sp. 9096]|uniref:hypothetical protein n=1 Tax=Massilia sp. 9096 TaxID=1500894 RepID=UPI00055CBE7D|nr:hypothetical protein [Massilia sp. 9096]